VITSHHKITELRFIGHLIYGHLKHPVEFVIPFSALLNFGIEYGNIESDGGQFVDLSHRATRPEEPDNSLPLEIRDHAGRSITMEDVNRAGQKEELLSARFPWLYDVEPIESNAPPLVTQLQRDLELVQHHLSKIIDANNKFIYGYQSRIAEVLKIPNQGGYRRRIKNVASALAHQYEISTSSNASILAIDSQDEIKAA
jgi:hypothetical protein